MPARIPRAAGTRRSSAARPVLPPPMTADPALRPSVLPWRSALVLWLLFLVISGGLGFHGVRRYDPWRIGMTDVWEYAHMVSGDLKPEYRTHRSYRILTPYLARPVYAAVQGRTTRLRPVLVALLVVNAGLMALAATVLVAIALRLGLGDAAGMLGACLLLLNIWIGNFYLVGLVDAAELCAVLLWVWALLDRRWWALPPIAVAGVLAKETFVVFAAVIAAVWWWMEWRRSPHARASAATIAGAVAAGLGTVLLARWMLSGGVTDPLQIAGSLARPGPGMLRRVVVHLVDFDFWAGFVWLGPLGVWSVRRLPRAWIVGAAAACGVAFLMALHAMAGAGNVGRPIFSLLGPPLSLAAAVTLLRQPWLPRPAAAPAPAR